MGEIVDVGFVGGGVGGVVDSGFEVFTGFAVRVGEVFGCAADAADGGGYGAALLSVRAGALVTALGSGNALADTAGAGSADAAVSVTTGACVTGATGAETVALG